MTESKNEHSERASSRKGPAPLVMPGLNAVAMAASLSGQQRAIHAIYKYLSEHLRGKYSAVALTQDKFTQDLAIDTWLLYSHSWNTSIGGTMNTKDMFFVCLCLDRVARSPAKFAGAPKKIEESCSVQKTLHAVKMLGAKWVTGSSKADEIDSLLDECAAIIVYGFIKKGLETIELLASTRFVYKSNPFKFVMADTENNSSETKKPFEMGTGEGTGETESERLQYEARELKIKTDSAVSECVNEFIPWCGRVFMAILFERRHILAPFLLPSGPASDAKDHPLKKPAWQFDPESLRGVTHRWLQEQVSYGVSSKVTNEFKDWAYRFLLAPGALDMSRRQRHLASSTKSTLELFTEDSDSGELIQTVFDSLNTDMKVIAEKQTHPMYNALFLTMFVSQMRNETTTPGHGAIELDKSYIYTEDQLIKALRDKRIQNTTWMLHKRRPFIVKSAGRFHVMLQSKMRRCRDVKEALVLWLVIMRDEFGGAFEDRRKIPQRWFDEFKVLVHKPQSVSSASSSASPGTESSEHDRPEATPAASEESQVGVEGPSCTACNELGCASCQCDMG